MKTETYECSEVAAEHPEVTSEAIEIIESLELEGQKGLISRTDGPNPIRCPYRMMKAEEKFVFELLCPQRREASEYKASAIPIRVLQVLAHANSLTIFKAYQIWAAEGEIKDPVLVAYTSTETWRSKTGPYILARWADELDSWAQLTKQAMVIWKAKTLSELKSLERKIRGTIETIEKTDISPHRANNINVPDFTEI